MISKSYGGKKFDKSRKIAYHFKTEHNTTLAKDNAYIEQRRHS